jgi:quinoprotein glucose dehydrogenase
VKSGEYRAPDERIDYRAKTFVVASGYCWSSHLLLLSRNARFPNGLANSSGLVGRYMNGHAFIQATASIDDQTFPGQNMTHSLISREYFRSPANRPFVRHDMRVWESSVGRDPRLRTPEGRLLLGDELMDDWRARTKGSSVRLRAYVDVHPSADSRLTLDESKKNRYGDPMPKIQHQFDEATRSRQAATKAHVLGVFEALAKSGNGRIVNTSEGDYLDHPGGGCRMGDDPKTSVCDSYGRAHDHENLFVVGAPTTPTGGCTNGTLTFAALTLRSADEIVKSS